MWIRNDPHGPYHNMKQKLLDFLTRRYLINKDRGFPFFYVMIDLHGTVIPHSRSGIENLSFINNDCKEALQVFSTLPGIALIAWSSTPRVKWEQVIEPWFKIHGINFRYFNENPDCSNGEYSNFDEKFYFDAGIDDKFNFDPNQDWHEVLSFASRIKYRAI